MDADENKKDYDDGHITKEEFLMEYEHILMNFEIDEIKMI